MESCPCDRQPDAKPQRASRPELADVFRLYGEQYRRAHRLPAEQIRVMHHIEMCRSATLGGHLDRCNLCGHERNAYNSCCDRHCPKCQSLATEKWLQARRADLLPVKYFHGVFALPHELNPLVLDNKVVLFKMLFSTVGELLQEFAANPRWKLRGQLGFIAVLHTWSQLLLDHFHLHCLIPAGALCADRIRWNPCPHDTFLFDVHALGRKFRGKFLAALKEAYKTGTLRFYRSKALQSPRAFYRMVAQLYRKDWIVYCKEPFAGPEQVLNYLGRYTHRIAISNNRIKSVSQEQVCFSYKDRSDQNRTKHKSLPADEFIRRFLLHVLPKGFMRIRHFGFLANAAKQQSLPRIREALGHAAEMPQPPEESVREMMQRLCGVDIALCPHCRKGTMHNTGLPPKALADHEP